MHPHQRFSYHPGSSWVWSWPTAALTLCSQQCWAGQWWWLAWKAQAISPGRPAGGPVPASPVHSPHSPPNKLSLTDAFTHSLLCFDFKSSPCLKADERNWPILCRHLGSAYPYFLINFVCLVLWLGGFFLSYLTNHWFNPLLHPTYCLFFPVYSFFFRYCILHFLLVLFNGFYVLFHAAEHPCNHYFELYLTNCLPPFHLAAFPDIFFFLIFSFGNCFLVFPFVCCFVFVSVY